MISTGKLCTISLIWMSAAWQQPYLYNMQATRSRLWGLYNMIQSSIDCSACEIMTEALTSGMVDLDRLVALQSASLFSQDVCSCWKLGTGLCRPQALPSGSNLLLHFSAWRPFPSLPSGDRLLCKACDILSPCDMLSPCDVLSPCDISSPCRSRPECAFVTLAGLTLHLCSSDASQ